MPSQPIVLSRILGRNGIDPPQDLPLTQAQEVLNVDFYEGSFGRKQKGASAVTLNGFTNGATIEHLFRYLPSDDETAAELHAIEGGALTTFQRLTGGTTWATVTLADAIQANATEHDAVNFAGAAYQAYNSAVNRLHMYPSAGGTHRRVGISQPSAPTSASAGAGSVSDTRKYAVCFTRQASSVTQCRSNLSSLSSALALSSENATITKPSNPGDSETHWEVYAYSIADNYSLGYLIATTAIGTSTATDSNATLDSVTMAAPPVTGQNTPPPSSKYLLTDGTHLLGLGAWETTAGTGLTPSPRLIWWTPAIGTSATDGDTERVSDTTDIKSYLYVDEGITGGGGPIMGSLYVFSYRKTYKLIPTGEAASAYQRINLRDGVGCIRHQTVVLAEDENGRPALYWLSNVGPYRAGSNGLEYIGRDVEDRWTQVNLDATGVAAFGLYVPALHQVWWYVAIGSSQNNPNEKWIYDCRLGRVVEINNVTGLRFGWSRANGIGTEARHGCLFANTLGASMSRDLKPYIGRCGTGISNPTLWKADSGTDYAGTNYQSYVQTKDFLLQPGHYVSMREDALLMAKTSSGVTITLTTNRDFAVESTTATALLTASASEARLQVKFEGAAISEAQVVNWTVGDGSAASNSWVLDRLTVPITVDDAR